MFKRTVEDFVCEHCRETVVGNGFTNHCPQCLWSKHVDVEPGDRAAVCGGMMKPVDIQKKGKEYIIIQTCEQCGFTRANKAQKEDNFDMILQVAAEKAGK